MTIRVIDIESEGTDPAIHRVVEIASVDVEESGQLLAPQTSLVYPGAGRKMPPDAQGVHHISATMLANAPSLDVIQKTILTQFPFPDKLVAFCAHNAAFEQGFLKQYTGTTPWLCTWKVAARLWPEAPDRKVQTLRYYLNLDIPSRYANANPHRALPDAVVTACLLREAAKLVSIPEMLLWSSEPLYMPVCPIGKKQGHAGKPWADVDGGFLKWVVGQPDMDADTKWNAQRELTRRHNGKTQS